jgi:hypothetical protein
LPARCSSTRHGLFVLLALALVAVRAQRPRGRADHGRPDRRLAADVRRRLCRWRFGQDLPTLEDTPVGELLDRIDGDVYQVAATARQRRAHGSRSRPVLSIGPRSSSGGRPASR